MRRRRRRRHLRRRVGVEPSIVGPGYDITLTDSTVADNSANDDGGGVYTEGALIATGSQFNENTADGNVWGGGRGGGAYARRQRHVDGHLVGGQRSTVRRVRHQRCGGHPAECGAVASGGGFFTYGTATVTSSTFTNNHAYDTGGGFLADDAVVTDSTFTGNNAGGESAESDGASASQLPAPVANHVTATDSESGSAFCLCAGGGFAVGTGIGDGRERQRRRRPGHRFHVHRQRRRLRRLLPRLRAAASSPVAAPRSPAATFGDPSDPENGSNAAGCFTACGAMGGGFYSAGTTNVDTSNFVFNGVGCLGNCAAEGGGFFAGNGLMEMSAGVTDALPSGASAALADNGSVDVVQSTFTLNEAGCYFVECARQRWWVLRRRQPDRRRHRIHVRPQRLAVGRRRARGQRWHRLPARICEGDCGTSDVTITNSTVTGNTSGYPAAISVPQAG